MPFLRDEGPPVAQATIQRARESLPLEFGFQVVNETGREVLLVRVPKVKPDYLHDLADVAFYVDLDTIRNTRDILLIGHEKTARLEPQLLRDHIRAQQREDGGVVLDLRRRLGAMYGHTIVHSPSNHHHRAIALRIPKQSVAEFAPEDVVKFREVMQSAKAQAEACQYAYIVAEKDFERLGRRVLLELLGFAPAAPEPLDASAAPEPAAAVALAPAPEPAAPPARPAFPATPAPAPAPAAAPRAPPVSHATAGLPGGLAGIVASALSSPNPTVPADGAAPEPEEGAAVEIHEEYEIVSRPKPAESAPPAAPPAAPAAAAAPDEDEPEYEIMTRAPAPAPAAPAAPALRAQTAASLPADEPEYEIMTRAPAPAPAAAPAPAPPPPLAGAPPRLLDTAGDRIVEKATESFEVYTSKPKPRPDAHAAAQAAGPPPAKTKEYEIIGREPAPVSAPLPLPAAPAAPAPVYRDDPRMIPPRAPLGVPSADNGAHILGTTAPANAEGVLAQRFRDAGYELVEGLKAQGTVFAFAAHKPNGRRVLVKRAGDFGAEDAATLAQLAVALGADVCVVVADRIAPATRLATWGTRIEVYSAAEVPTLVF